MRKFGFLPAIAASLVLAAPAAAAQSMSPAEARAQMQRYCAETANRTDEAGRNWYATYCGPRAVAVAPTTNAVPIAVGIGMAAFLLFLFGQ